MYQQTKTKVHFYTLLCQFQRLRRQARLRQPKKLYFVHTKERESLRSLIAQTVPHWYKYDNGEPAHHSSYVLLMLHILCRNPRTNIGLVLAVKNSGCLYKVKKIPIHTGHGRNQPIYECHVTTASRNRVKNIAWI